MYAEEIANLYRSWVDESDAAWHTSIIPTILKVGYNEFRRRIIEQQPFVYASSVDIAVSGYSYDLRAAAVSVLGATPTDTRMEKALELRYINPGGRPGHGIPIMPDTSQMLRQSSGAACIRASVLEFNWLVNETLRFWYVGEPSVDWTRISAGDNEFVDDLGAYHELIAVYAAEYYGIRDNATPRVERVRQRLERSLVDFLLRYHSDRIEIGSLHG